MPIYEYECRDCHHRFEAIVRLNESPVCASCQSANLERLINVVHDAAIGAGKRLCGPFAWRDRPDFTCFQNASETAAIAAGVAAELGALKDTQGKVEVGPLAQPMK